eukprot:gb/GEZJ01000245.1/.p1 GENE.gb/GEZJ01000245.1/~~gb/GEZJ01000245.1/.p1  ORF type:complete len:128 (-),score=22.72 gb/GEZJ01000245.1/:199-582(-)
MKYLFDGFDVENFITQSYSESITLNNIRTSVQVTGNYVNEKHFASVEPHNRLFGDDKENQDLLENAMSSYEESSRSLLLDANVEESGIVRINSALGVNLTNNAVIGVLKTREQRCNAKVSARQKKND